MTNFHKKLITLLTASRREDAWKTARAVWAERRISSSNLVPARFFQRQFLAGVSIGVGKTCTGVPLSPRWRCFSENSMRRRENYQRRRESRQRWILPPYGVTTAARRAYQLWRERCADVGGAGGGTLLLAGYS